MKATSVDGLKDIAQRVSVLQGQERSALLQTEAKKLGVGPAELEKTLAALDQGQNGASSIGSGYAAQNGSVRSRNKAGAERAGVMTWHAKINVPEDAQKLADHMGFGKLAPEKMGEARGLLASRFGLASKGADDRYEIIPFEEGAIYRRKGGATWRPVPADVPKGMTWDNVDPGYAPIHYIGLEVMRQVKLGALGQKTWAHANNLDRATLDAMVAKMRTRGKEGLEPVRQDPETGLPLNPAGPTGISGRGESNLGPIHAQDMFVRTTNPETGEQFAILIRRKDTGQWAMPGGIVDPNDSEAKVPAAVATALREFEEETGAKPSEAFTQHLMTADGVFEGVCKKDPRNTDNMWFETRVMAAEVPWEIVSGFMKEAKGSDDASDARLVKLTPEVIGDLYADHPDFVALAMKHLDAQQLG
jgi:ADP-ribose pyrophosphatase